jgi:hypothetical protein
MALLDLRDAGGTDHLTAVAAGVEWVRSHPETDAALLDEATGAIWRKVGRREPRKLVRAIRAASTSVAPRLTVGLLDRAFPAGVVDHECRPYELGWLLYAWHSARIAGPSGHAPDPGVREEAQRGGV